MSTEFAYPKRPKFFSHKFCRIMWKCCLANEIGSDICWLLSGIAMTEDAKGYRSAVTYFNEQLSVVAGYGSVDAMCRARSKAVKAGWLAYKPGGKGFAGKYYVTIPKAHSDWDDLPTDENNEHDDAVSANSKTEQKPSPKHSDDLVYIRTSAEESAKEPRTIREASAEESAKQVRTKCGTFFPIPIPNPIPIPIHSEPVGSDGECDICEPIEIAEELNTKQAVVVKDQPKTPKPKKARKPWPMYDAIAAVTGCKGSHVAKVAHEIESEDNPLTPEEIYEFGRRFVELCPYVLIDGVARLPNVGELGKFANRVRAAPPIPIPEKQQPRTFRQTDSDEANNYIAESLAKARAHKQQQELAASSQTKLQLTGGS